MKIREFQMADFESVTITVKKDTATYRSSYSVSICRKGECYKITKTTYPDRKSAKQAFIKLVIQYTPGKITLSEINKRYRK